MLEISARGGSKRGSVWKLGHIEATSAGLCATSGAPAAPFAQTVAREWGQDLSGHEAALFRPEHAAADLIVTMTSNQSAVVRAHFGVDAPQVQLLGGCMPCHAQTFHLAKLTPFLEANFGLGCHETEDESDILDPLGGSLEAYEACSARIRRCVFELAHTLSSLG